MHVTTRSTARAGISDAAQRHVLSCRDTSWNLDGYFLLRPQPSFAAALLARRLNHLSFATTRRTRRDRNELTEERPLRATNLTGARARGARLRFGPRLGAVPIAAIAG